MRKLVSQLSFICVLAVTASCSTAGKGWCSFSDSREVVYHAAGTGVVNRYEMDNLWHSSEGLDFLECKERPTNHFGGDINLISSDKFVGMSSPYTIVVPKNFGKQHHWVIDGISCVADRSLLEQQEITVTCSKNDSSDTTFVYKPDVGVIEYVYSRSPNLKFHLVSEQGLFEQ